MTILLTFFIISWSIYGLFKGEEWEDEDILRGKSLIKRAVAVFVCGPAVWVVIAFGGLYDIVGNWLRER